MLHKTFITLTILVLLSNIQASVITQKHADMHRVKQQHQNDIEQKEAIKKKIYELMRQINANLESKEALVAPVEPDKATDIVDHEEYTKKEANQKPNAETKEKKESFIAPTKGKMTSAYGYRENPVTKKYSFHKGIDIAAPKGTKVVASASGHVVTSQYMNNGYGNCIIIQHENQVKTVYAHLDKRLVKEGDTVTQGQQIGTVGATGRATGPHLHYEVYKGTQPINPEELVHY